MKIKNSINEKETKELIESILKDEQGDFCSYLITDWDVFLNYEKFNLMFKLHGEYSLDIYTRIIKLFKSLNQDKFRDYSLELKETDIPKNLLAQGKNNYNRYRIVLGYSFINIPKDSKYTLEELVELEDLIMSCLNV